MRQNLGEKLLGARVHWVIEELLGRTVLHNQTLIHKYHFICRFMDRASQPSSEIPLPTPRLAPVTREISQKRFSQLHLHFFGISTLRMFQDFGILQPMDRLFPVKERLLT